MEKNNVENDKVDKTDLEAKNYFKGAASKIGSGAKYMINNKSKGIDKELDSLRKNRALIHRDLEFINNDIENLDGHIIELTGELISYEKKLEHFSKMPPQIKSENLDKIREVQSKVQKLKTGLESANKLKDKLDLKLDIQMRRNSNIGYEISYWGRKKEDLMFEAEYVSEKIDEKFEYFEEKADEMISKIGNVKDAIIDKTVDMKDTVIDKAVDIKDTVVDKAVDIKDTVIDKAVDIKDTVIDKAVDIKDTVVDKALDIKDTVVDKVGYIKGKVDKGAVYTRDAVKDGIDSVKEATNNAAKFTKDVIDKTVDVTKQGFEYASDKAKSFKEYAKVKIQSNIDKFKGYRQGFLDKLTEKQLAKEDVKFRESLVSNSMRSKIYNKRFSFGELGAEIENGAISKSVRDSLMFEMDEDGNMGGSLVNSFDVGLPLEGNSKVLANMKFIEKNGFLEFNDDLNLIELEDKDGNLKLDRKSKENIKEEYRDNFVRDDFMQGVDSPCHLYREEDGNQYLLSESGNYSVKIMQEEIEGENVMFWQPVLNANSLKGKGRAAMQSLIKNSMGLKEQISSKDLDMYISKCKEFEASHEIEKDEVLENYKTKDFSNEKDDSLEL